MQKFVWIVAYATIILVLPLPSGRVLWDPKEMEATRDNGRT